MKKIICVLCLIFYSTDLLPQEMFSVDVFADPKMAVQKDDHGNTPFTLNVLMNCSVQFKQREYGYYSLGQSLEYADLDGGRYMRYSFIQVGYTFNRFGFTDKLEASVALNYGLIRRWSRGFCNYGSNFDISYSFSDRLKFTSLLQVVRRLDIESPVEKNAIFRASVFFGLKFNISPINNMI